MLFSFYTSNEIVFGPNQIVKAGELAARFGTRAFICTRGQAMKETGMLDRLCGSLKGAGIGYEIDNLPAHEPDVDEMDTGAERLRRSRAEVIIALGGGSTIDTGKALSGLATNPGGIYDYLEGVGRGLALSSAALPFIAIPTTAGTGSEVTKNAVISSRTKKFKKSMRSPYMIPRIALLDPELTLSLPPDITAFTGMDALTQLIESYVSARAQPLPEALALDGISRAGAALERAVSDGRDLQAREQMLLASLLSGIALANSGLGAAHGIAAALGAHCGIAHGRACAMLLPGVMQLNLPACRGKFGRVAAALTQNPRADAERAVFFIEQLCRRINIAAKFEPDEIPQEIVPELVVNSRGSSMSGNPVELSDQQIEDLIRKLLP